MVVLPVLLFTDVMIHGGAELFFMTKLPLLGRDGGLSHSCIKKQPRILLANWNSVNYSWKPGHCCWCQEARVLLPCLSSEKMARLWSHFVTSNLNGVFSSVWFWVEENQTLMCRVGQWICSRAKSILNYLLVSDSLQQPPSYLGPQQLGPHLHQAKGWNLAWTGPHRTQIHHSNTHPCLGTVWRDVYGLWQVTKPG